MILNKTLLFVSLFLVLSLVPDSHAQSNSPIETRGLLTALKSEVLSSSDLIDLVQKRGVSFQLTPAIEKQIRVSGKYLGKKDLDDLVGAVRENHRPKKPKPTDGPVITQTMTNSPGGVQVGGNLTVNQGRQQRTLTSDQRAKLIASSQSYLRQVPQGPVKVTAVMGDEESIAFAEELTKVLKDAGWKVQYFEQSTFVPTVPVGLSVMVRSRESAPIHGAALQRAFSDAGLIVPAGVYPGVPVGMVELLVGRQP